MEVLCLRENPKWRNIHSGRIYTAISTRNGFFIAGNNVGKVEILKYFKVL